jgi:membrane protein
MKMRDLFQLLKDSFQQWQADNAVRLAAALSYFTIFSIAPLLILVIAIAGAVFGQEAARGQIDNQIEGLVGREGADFVQEMIQNASRPASGTLAAVISMVTLVLGAVGVFWQLQDALNTIWGVVLKPQIRLLDQIRYRLFSLTLVLALGFLLLVSLVISAVLGTIAAWLNATFPGAVGVLQGINLVLSLTVVTLIFGLLYKYVPNVKIAWRDVWIGAFVTALLFSIGKYLIGLYLGQSGITSVYGAAGSLAILLLWVFYSAQILFFGAEFTRLYADRFGSHIQPSEDAMSLMELVTSQRGITPEVEREVQKKRQEQEKGQTK